MFESAASPDRQERASHLPRLQGLPVLVGGGDPYAGAPRLDGRAYVVRRVPHHDDGLPRLDAQKLARPKHGESGRLRRPVFHAHARDVRAEGGGGEQAVEVEE